MSERLQCIEQEPPSPADASVIWMHGLGAGANDFESMPAELSLPEEPAVRFIFPQAPSIPVTLNGGMVMPAWYDILALSGGAGRAGRDSDEAGIRRSEGQIRDLVERELERGVSSDKIVLAGFSQGGAMALHTALRFPKPLAGVMVLSAYLLLSDRLAEEAVDANREVPIFQAHGTFDPMVRHEYAVKSRDLLIETGREVEWHEYPMGHQVCLPEIRAIREWLVKVLS